MRSRICLGRRIQVNIVRRREIDRAGRTPRPPSAGA